MNCANHPGVPIQAYCRVCGKPLCEQCKRDVMGVIYCEQCLADRLKDVHPNVPPPPTPGFVPVAPQAAGIASPHPAVAGILAGFFPFGVGAVYTGQYAKGLAHLLVFTGLIWGVSSGHVGGMEPVLGIALAFFIMYQVIDAVRSAHAIRLGQPPPDPFGFGRTFGIVDRPAQTAASGNIAAPAAPHTSAPAVPTAAVILIGLGALFLLQTVGIFEFNVSRIWPLFLIGLGVWLFLARSGILGHDPNLGRHARAGFGCDPYRYSRRAWSGPIWLITIGALFLIQSMDGPSFGRTWPLLLLVAGLMKLLDHTNPQPPRTGAQPPIGFDPGAVNPPAAPPSAPSVSSEVKNG